MKKNTTTATLIFIACIAASCAFGAQFDQYATISPHAHHNKTVPLLALDSKSLNHILGFAINPNHQIATNMETSLNLMESCKFFNNMLPELGIKFQGCNESEINREIYNLREKSTPPFSHYYRRKLLLLIHARGRSDKTFYRFSLLQDAAHEDDVEMASTLLKYGGSANEISKVCGQPVFFSVASLQMFKLFSDHGANWTAIAPSGYSILHIKADNQRPTQKDITVFEKLLQTIPKLINAKSVRDELTALDYAREVPKYYKNSALIDLLVFHGGRTAEELIDDAIWTEEAIADALRQTPITPSTMKRIERRIPLLKTRFR